MITSNGYTVPLDDDRYMRSLVERLSEGVFSRVGQSVIPVGRSEWYQTIALPESRDPLEVLTLWTDRETASDSPAEGWDFIAPFAALYDLATSPDSGDEVEVETRKVALPVRLLAPLPSDFVGPLNLPPDLAGAEAEKRGQSAAGSYADSKRQLDRDLRGIVTPDIDLFDSPIAKWAIVAGVIVAAFAVVVVVRRR